MGRNGKQRVQIAQGQIQDPTELKATEATENNGHLRNLLLALVNEQIYFRFLFFLAYFS